MSWTEIEDESCAAVRTTQLSCTDRDSHPTFQQVHAKQSDLILRSALGCPVGPRLLSMTCRSLLARSLLYLALTSTTCPGSCASPTLCWPHKSGSNQHLAPADGRAGRKRSRSGGRTASPPARRARLPAPPSARLSPRRSASPPRRRQEGEAARRGTGRPEEGRRDSRIDDRRFADNSEQAVPPLLDGDHSGRHFVTHWYTSYNDKRCADSRKHNPTLPGQASLSSTPLGESCHRLFVKDLVLCKAT